MSKRHGVVHHDAEKGTVSLSRTGGVIEDAGLLLLLAFMVPLAILAFGTPVAIAVRVLLELARRL